MYYIYIQLVASSTEFISGMKPSANPCSWTFGIYHLASSNHMAMENPPNHGGFVRENHGTAGGFSTLKFARPSTRRRRVRKNEE